MIETLREIWGGVHLILEIMGASGIIGYGFGLGLKIANPTWIKVNINNNRPEPIIVSKD